MGGGVSKAIRSVTRAVKSCFRAVSRVFQSAVSVLARVLHPILPFISREFAQALLTRLVQIVISTVVPGLGAYATAIATELLTTGTLDWKRLALKHFLGPLKDSLTADSLFSDMPDCLRNIAERTVEGTVVGLASGERIKIGDYIVAALKGEAANMAVDAVESFATDLHATLQAELESAKDSMVPEAARLQAAADRFVEATMEGLQELGSVNVAAFSPSLAASSGSGGAGAQPTAWTAAGMLRDTSEAGSAGTVPTLASLARDPRAAGNTASEVPPTCRALADLSSAAGGRLGPATAMHVTREPTTATQRVTQRATGRGGVDRGLGGRVGPHTDAHVALDIRTGSAEAFAAAPVEDRAAFTLGPWEFGTYTRPAEVSIDSGAATITTASGFYRKHVPTGETTRSGVVTRVNAGRDAPLRAMWDATAGVEVESTTRTRPRAAGGQDPVRRSHRSSHGVPGVVTVRRGVTAGRDSATDETKVELLGTLGAEHVTSRDRGLTTSRTRVTVRPARAVVAAATVGVGAAARTAAGVLAEVPALVPAATVALRVKP